jgi:hypothetical protein
MAWINTMRGMRLAAGIAVTASLALGASAGTASAHWDHPDARYHGWHHGWSGGYWGAPPVVYGSPYSYGYYPPPGVGINLPGVAIGIR